MNTDARRLGGRQAGRQAGGGWAGPPQPAYLVGHICKQRIAARLDDRMGRGGVGSGTAGELGVGGLSISASGGGASTDGWDQRSTVTWWMPSI